MSLPTDTGVRVAPGDPGQLSAAASWHSDLADGLDSHATTIDGTAGSLAGTWQGDAASSYQALSGMVSAHFRGAAGTSRSAAASLRRYSSELERAQQEGMHALSQAEHWLEQARTDQAKLTATQAAVTAAEAEVTGAETGVVQAANVVGHGAAATAAAAASRLSSAQSALSSAQAAERAAQKALTKDEDQLAHWQARGRQAWEDAIQAAETATGSLDPLCVAPPPLAAGPAFPSPLAGGSELPIDLYGGATGAFAGFWTSVAGGNLNAAREEVQNLAAEYNAEYDASHDPALWPWERAAAAERADDLAPEIRNVVDSESGLAADLNFGEHFLGYGAGGVLDAGIRIASGENVGRSAAQGVGAAVGGDVGATVGGTACAASGLLAPITPLCAAAGGAAGGLGGDLLGGLVDSLASDL
jgi:hypothetical protein